jgi:hypothetical protein
MVVEQIEDEPFAFPAADVFRIIAAGVRVLIMISLV